MGSALQNDFCLGRRLFSWIVIWACFGVLNAQSAQDSLLKTFEGIGDQAARLDSMAKVSREVGLGGNGALGLWLAQKAYEQSLMLKLPRQQMTTIFAVGGIYLTLGARDLALEQYLKGLHLADSLGDLNYRAIGWNNIGSIQSQELDFEGALASLKKARQDFLSASNKQRAAEVLLNMASVYSDLKDWNKAILTSDTVMRELAPFEDPYSFGVLYHNLGLVYAEMGQNGKSIGYFDLAIENGAKAEDLYGLAEAHISRGTSKFSLEAFEEAVADVELGIKESIELGSPDLEARGYKALSDFAKGSGKPAEALEWLERSLRITDSLQTDERKSALANMQAIYSVELKDAEIDLLNKDKAVQDANLSKGKYLNGLLGLGLIAMVALALVLFFRSRIRKRVNQELGLKNSQILAQKEEIETQNTILKSQNDRLEDLNREMDGILHVVAHDLKAPLNQTAGLVSLVMDAGGLSADQISYLEMLLKVNGNAGRLVRDLVEISKLESEKEPMQLESLDLVALVQETVSFLEVEAQRKSIALDLQLPLWSLVIDSERSFITRILDNLVTNAIKFSKPNKTVFIQVADQEDGVMIEIRDQGPGISREDQAKLFKKFQRLTARPTAGESTTGLGLAIVQALVIRLKGRISVKSNAGEGTAFVVWLPK